MSHARFLQLVQQQPQLFDHAGLFHAGDTIVQLKHLGLSDATIRASVVAR